MYAPAISKVSLRQNAETNTGLIKSIIASAFSAICLLLFLFMAFLIKEEPAIDIITKFNALKIISALFNGGNLQFYVAEIGNLTLTLPIWAILMTIVCTVLCIVAFIANMLRLAAIVKKRIIKSEKLYAHLSFAAAAALLLSFITFLFLKVPATDISGQRSEFYKVFRPETSTPILALLYIISALMDLNLNSEKFSLMKKYIPSYLFMILPICLIAVFNLYPIFLQTILSFKEYTLGTGIFHSEWVGFKNFNTIFTDPQMIMVITNTIFISLLRLIAHTIPPLVLSIFLYDLRLKRTRKAVQTIVYIPHFFSWVIIYGISYAFLNEEGILAGVLGLNHNILHDRIWFIPIVILTDIWKELGWGTILYLAALSSVDTELFEAAKLDGAGPMQRVLKITLPSILPIIIYLLIMNLGNILKSAGGEQLLLFAGATTKQQATVIDTWLYWVSMGQFKYSLGAAVSFFQAAIGIALVIGANKLSKKTTGIGMW